MSLIPKISKRVDWFIGHAGFFWRHDPLYLLGLDIGWHRQCQYGEVMKFGEHVFNDIINLFHDDFSWIFESPVTAFTKSQIPKKALMLNLVMYSASSRCVCVCLFHQTKKLISWRYGHRIKPLASPQINVKPGARFGPEGFCSPQLYMNMIFFFPVLFEGFLVFFVFQLDVLPFFNLRNLRNSEISVVRLASKFFRSKESPEFGWTHKDGSFDQLLGEDPTKMEGLLGDECFACVSFGGVGRCYVSSRLKRGVLNKTRGRYEWSSTVLLGDVSMRFKLRGVKYIHSTQVFETYRLGVCSNFQSGSQWRQFEASMMISCPVGY